jgi:hypothetical protein
LSSTPENAQKAARFRGPPVEDRRNRGNLDGKTLPLINTDDTDQNGGRRTYRGSGKLPEAPKLPKSPKLEGKTPLINTDDTDQNGGKEDLPRIYADERGSKNCQKCQNCQDRRNWKAKEPYH